MHLRSIIIPAAGLGTRLLPATKAVPKELLNVYDRPVLQFAIDEAIATGAERIIVVIHPDKLTIRDYLKPDLKYIDLLSACAKDSLSAALVSVQVPKAVEVVFAYQVRPLGLGQEISCCGALILPGPVGVILPDDVIMGTPCLFEMAKAYVGGHMVAAMTVPVQDAPRYGIFKLLGTAAGLSRSIAASNMVEKPQAGTEPSLLAAVGRYILDPVIFATLRGIPRGAGGEIQLSDAIDADAARLTLTAFRFSGQRFDCGSHDGLIEAAVARQRIVKDQNHTDTALLGAARASASINQFPTSPQPVENQTPALEGIAS